MRESAKRTMREYVETMVELRATSALKMLEQDLPRIDITICRGPGRCLIPNSSVTEGSCPFCACYPPQRNTSNATEISRQLNIIIGGN